MSGQEQSTSKNRPCDCGSKIKFKHCCMKKKIPSEFKTGQLDSSEKVAHCIIKLKTKYPNHKIIDITDKLNDNTYKPFQIANYYDSTIMIAEKTPSNSSVFSTRVDSAQSDVMVMYHGSFRTFPFEYLDRVFDSVCAMIK
jgi:hypothetical protein